MESGKAGCFSPKISRKEKVRRSLRLKFNLGKNSKDGNECSGVNRSENVGRRLANQQSLKNRIDSVKTGLLFSPDTDERLTKKGSKKISKSEGNLLTPERLSGTNYRISWIGPSNSDFQEVDGNEASPIDGTLEVENSSLEPDMMVEKSPVSSYELTPPNVHSKHSNNITGSSLSGDENNLTTETVVKIQKAFSESGSNLHALINHKQSSLTNVEKVKFNETSSTKGSPEKNLLKTNLTVIESNGHHTSNDEESFSERDFSLHQPQISDREATIKCYSTQMKIQLENNIHLNIPTDYLSKQELRSDEHVGKQESPRDTLNTKLKEHENLIEENLLKHTASREVVASTSSLEQSTCSSANLSKPGPGGIIKQQSLVETRDETVSECLQMTEHGRVSDHIQWFNRLSLNEPNRTKVKSPLKFQRTPVRQSVRRINSLLEYGGQPPRRKLVSLGDTASPLVKSVSCESALPSCVESMTKDSSHPCARSGPKEQKSSCKQSNIDMISKSSMEVTSTSFLQMKRHSHSVNASLGSTRVCKQEVMSNRQIKVPLDDLTNHDMVRSTVSNDKVFPPGVSSRVLRKPSEKERIWYKGSPKNPIGKVQLLPTSRPVDL